MNVQELIDRLQSALDGGDIQPETVVKLVYQANYPLQDNLKGIWYNETESVDETVGTVYIVSGGQDYDQPYGPRAAFEEAW